MKLLICKADAIADTAVSIPDWKDAEELGHSINNFEGKPDAIVSMSISQMEKTFALVNTWPDVPLYCYNWDCYEWVWESPRIGEYNYARYGELLARSTEVWVPSESVQMRTKQWWGIDDSKIILSCCPWWDYDNIRDDGYALSCLRRIPDPQWGMFERACEELDIPYICTRHECDFKVYQNILAGCKFLVAPLYELSTGGLSLLEGYYLGKPCLISDSKWNGGRDYFGNRARYFRHNDYEHFKDQLWHMYKFPKLVQLNSYKKYITNNFSNDRMVGEMLTRILETKK